MNVKLSGQMLLVTKLNGIVGNMPICYFSECAV